MDLDVKKVSTIVIAVFLVIILMGNVISFMNPYHSSFNAERVNSNEIKYSIDSNLSLNYTAVTLDKGGHYNIDTYVIFWDDDYIALANDARASISWLEHGLKKYDIAPVILGTMDVLNIINNSETNIALIFTTGTFPKEIYSGDAADPIFKWLKSGGIMYWMGGALGATYAERGSADLSNSTDGDRLFFDNDDVVRKEYKQIKNGDFQTGSLTDIMGIYFTDCTSGLNTDRLKSPFLSLDYRGEGYSAVTFVKYYDGDGMICNLGGILTHDSAVITAHTIAPMLSYDSIILGSHTAQISKEPNGTLPAVAGMTDVFIYIGKMDVITGQLIRIS